MMKKYTPIFTIIASVLSFCGFAQGGDSAPFMKNIDGVPDEVVIVSYHVEERINMQFGSRITCYDVPNLSMVSTRDLGPNNSRRITPKFGKAKLRSATISVIADINILQPTILTKGAVASVVPIKIPVPTIVGNSIKTVNIDILQTYERVLDKGYKSIPMLKRVGNGRFFDGDLVVAAKWYAKLFDMTNDLETEYYFRYAASLKAINQLEKSNEMMAIYESRSALENHPKKP